MRMIHTQAGRVAQRLCGATSSSSADDAADACDALSACRVRGMAAAGVDAEEQG